MRAHLLFTALLLATAGILTPARADEPADERAPLPEALQTLLQEDRFAKRIEVTETHNRSDAWRLVIRPGSRRPPYACLDANEMGRLIQALDGVKITELDYTADPELLPLLGKLSGIRHLYLRGQFDGIDAALRELLPLLPDLTDLQIQAPRLGNSGLEEIARHPNIDSLLIFSPEIDDEGLRHLRNMRQLTGLHCHAYADRVSDAVFAVFAELSNLKQLDIGSRQITGSELGRLARLEKLRSLSLMGTGITDDSLQHLAGCTQLRSLTLAGTQVTDRGIAALAPLKDLRALRLDSAPITDDAIVRLAELPHLESLNLDSTNLTDAACTRISKLPSLKHLYLNSTYVADPGVAALADCPHLTGLQLSNCGLTDRCVADLCRLKSLTHLDVEQTDLTPAGVQALRDGLGKRCELRSGGPRDPNRQGLPKPLPVRRRQPRQ